VKTGKAMTRDDARGEAKTGGDARRCETILRGLTLNYNLTNIVVYGYRF